jgi:hypothetical protein
LRNYCIIVSNVETDHQLKKRAREYIIQEFVKKYRLEGDSEFTPEEMEKGATSV